MTVALIHRKGGSQTPDRWFKTSRNNHTYPGEVQVYAQNKHFTDEFNSVAKAPPLMISLPCIKQTRMAKPRR